jgi:hypothetical protein
MGTARSGPAWSAAVRSGEARLGGAWQGPVGRHAARHARHWQSMVWFGGIGSGEARHGLAQPWRGRLRLAKAR